MTKPRKWWGEESGRQPKRGKIVNRNELAKLFDVTPPTINKWQDLGMPVIKKGGRGVPDEFDAADCLWWRVDYVARQRTGEVGDSLSLRKLKADTELVEAKRDRFMEAHIPPSMMVEVIEATYANVDAQLVGIAKEASPLVAKEPSLLRCRAIIERAINNARKRLVSPAALASLNKRLGVKE